MATTDSGSGAAPSPGAAPGRALPHAAGGKEPPGRNRSQCALLSRACHRHTQHGESAFGKTHHPTCPLSPARSEEHTSELQSPDTISYAVFCLKKKNRARSVRCEAARNDQTRSTM